MRTTLSGYYRNLQFDQTKTAKELFDVTKQISSGQKIQYAHEDTSVFIDTVRLDNEVTTLEQASHSAQKALQFSTNTDSTMGEMSRVLDSMKVSLIYAANEVHSSTSLNAIALELRGLEENLIQLANTSVDGKYLFSGSEIKTSPIANDGTYKGNDGDINAFIGSGITQKYNVSGADLFLGAENDIRREVTTNIPLLDKTTNLYAISTSTLEEVTGSAADQYFYIRGTNHDGSSFKNKVALPSTSSIEELMTAVENSYTPNSVHVSLDKMGGIVVTDRVSGSSKLDFHMVASEADVNDVNTLTPLVLPPNVPVPPSVSIDFMKSGLTPSSVATGTESAIYDRTFFDKEGAVVTSNVAQVVKMGTLDADGNNIGNEFATDATKLSDVFASMATPLHIEGVDIAGTPFNIDINFNASPVTVSGDYNYTVGDGLGNDTLPADMTYRQLMDVVNMAMNGQTPADNDAGYRAAVNASNTNSTLELSYDGKLKFTDINNNPSSVELSMYDANTNDFTNTTGSIATFNTNNALTISDPKTDFFKQINDLISAVEMERIHIDGNGGSPRNIGVENSIQVLDDLMAHFGSQHAVAGTQSQVLERTVERNAMLIVTTKTLRSETLDVDIAEASLELKQLELNYQAMLSTVSRISQLSLVNYL